MTNPPTSYLQQHQELSALIDQARKKIFATRAFYDIHEWINQAANISEAFGDFAGAIEDGCAHTEAWGDAECDLYEFKQWVNHLDTPDFFNDVYGDIEDIKELSDLSRQILRKYVDALHSELNTIHDFLLNVVETLITSMT